MYKSFAFVALLAMAPVAAVAAAQAPAAPAAKAGGKVVTKENKVTASVTIKAIDPATRTVTLRGENGDEDTFKVGPEVKRFNELKVGDQITATYYESLVFEVRKPGEASTPSGAVGGGARLKNAPGGALATQQTTTVTVKAVDMIAPSITVETADGHTMTRKIADKKNLEGVHAGDKIDITYTQGLLVAAETPKK